MVNTRGRKPTDACGPAITLQYRTTPTHYCPRSRLTGLLADRRRHSLVSNLRVSTSINSEKLAPFSVRIATGSVMENGYDEPREIPVYYIIHVFLVARSVSAWRNLRTVRSDGRSTFKRRILGRCRLSPGPRRMSRCRLSPGGR